MRPPLIDRDGIGSLAPSFLQSVAVACGHSVVRGSLPPDRSKTTPGGAGHRHRTMTIDETDLPCSACGGDLRTRTARTDDLPIEVDASGPVVAVATCTDCGERHYPADALTALHQQIDRSGGSA